MPEWCPKCHAMLPSGLETCPACGARLPTAAPTKIASITSNEDTPAIGGKDIAWLSAYIIGIALVPILIAAAIGIICVLAAS